MDPFLTVIYCIDIHAYIYLYIIEDATGNRTGRHNTSQDRRAARATRKRATGTTKSDPIITEWM
jgi:hypothetical protein